MMIPAVPAWFNKVRVESARPDGPRTGDILLFSQAIGLTRVIPWCTGSRYYHCALYEGHGVVVEARPQGVVRRDIAAQADNVFRIIPMPHPHGKRALDFAQAQLGRRYDTVDVALIMLRHKFPGLNVYPRGPHAYFCTSLVAQAWRTVGRDLFPGTDVRDLIPSDFGRFLPPDSRDEMLS